jgi:hypothetical protein
MEIFPSIEILFNRKVETADFLISCHTPNYQILLIYNIYDLNISRFQPLDILVFKAVISTLKK